LRQFPPSRIICLTEETVETLYLLGEQDRIVGVSGYAVRPPQVRREKPRISAFTSADIPKILALEPDLVLTFSDLQAEIAAELIGAGIAVHAFNQRDIAGILAMIRSPVGSVAASRTRPSPRALGMTSWTVNLSYEAAVCERSISTAILYTQEAARAILL
jgi:iron complex transport system substrate-binding protein